MASKNSNSSYIPDTLDETQATDRVNKTAARVTINHDNDDASMQDKDSDTKEMSHSTSTVHPVDKGWAWVILFAAVLNMFLYGGQGKAQGIFFLEYQKRFGSSAVETTIMSTIQNITTCIGGIIVMSIFLQHVSQRQSICCGAILTFVTHVISAFATDINVMNVTIGFIGGEYWYFLYLLAYHLYDRCLFQQTSNSIASSGSSVGGLVFGPTYTYLFDNYGYTGTMLLTAAILSNILIVGLLMRPPSFYNYKRNQKIPLYVNPNTTERGALLYSDESKIDTLNTNKDELDISKAKQSMLESKHFVQNSQLSKANSHELLASQTDESWSPLVQRARANTGSDVLIRNRTISENTNRSVLSDVVDSISRSKVAVYASTEIVNGSVININSDNYLKSRAQKDVSNKKKSSNTKSVTKRIINFLRSTFDVKLLKDPILIHCLFIAFTCMPASIIVQVYLIPHGKDMGIPNQHLGMLFSVIGAVDLVSRIGVGFITDKRWLRPTTILATSMVMLAITCTLLRFVKNYQLLIVYAIVQSAFSGVYVALFAVILVEHIGIERFKSSLGFVGMVHGASTALFFPITGMLRDNTGNYLMTYHLLSGLQVCGAVLFITLPITYRWNKNTNKS